MLARDSNLKTCILPGLKAQKVEEHLSKGLEQDGPMEAIFRVAPVVRAPVFHAIHARHFYRVYHRVRLTN